MKMVMFCIWIAIVQSLAAQQSGVKVYDSYSITKISSDSLSLNIRITIVNDNPVVYFYPKAFEQKPEGKILTHSFRLLKYHTTQDLSFDIATEGLNSYDTLWVIKPGDSLILQYNDILLNSKDRKIIINNYVIPDQQDIKSMAGGAKYLDRYKKGVKIIEYNLAYKKQKINKSIKINNYLELK